MTHWTHFARQAGLAAALLLALPIAARAQTLPDWTATDANATAQAVTVDAGGNSYVLGTLPGPNLVLTKLAPTGTTLWQRGLGTPGTLARGNSASVDASGNVLVAGALADASGIAQGALLLKFDAAGTLLWQAGAAGLYTYALRAESDSAGNVYALWRTATVIPGAPTVVEMHLGKYSPAGVLQWSRTYGANSASADSMVVTAAGTAIVGGEVFGTGQSVLAAFDTLGNPLWSSGLASSNSPGLALGRSGELVAVGSASLSFLVAKYDAAFNPLWSTTVAARGGASRAAIDSQGNIVVSGVTDANTGALQVILYNWLTMKFSPAGALLWSQPFGAAGFTSDVPYGLAIGADDAIYLAGQGYLPNPVQAGAYTPSTATVKYTAAGVQAWVAHATGASRAVGLKLSTDGGVIVAGDAPQTVLRYGQSGLPNQAPTALASASPSAGTAPLAVAFSSAGSADADGRIAAYAWDFGDGQTSALANPTHTYPAGQYTVRLTVTDSLGASASAAPIVVTSNVAAPPPTPVSLVLAKTSLVGGSSTTATVTVSSSAGVTVALGSSSSLVKVPSTVVVPKGATRASFTVRTSSVRRDTVAAIAARANGVNATASLTLLRR